VLNVRNFKSNFPGAFFDKIEIVRGLLLPWNTINFPKAPFSDISRVLELEFFDMNEREEVSVRRVIVGSKSILEGLVLLH